MVSNFNDQGEMKFASNRTIKKKPQSPIATPMGEKKIRKMNKRKNDPKSPRPRTGENSYQSYGQFSYNESEQAQMTSPGQAAHLRKMKLPTYGSSFDMQSEQDMSHDFLIDQDQFNPSYKTLIDNDPEYIDKSMR